MDRVHNFCPGPCTLPVTVIDELAAELPNFEDLGVSFIEMSHRSAPYENVHEETIALLRELSGAPDDFKILLLQGGATLQFSMAPLNMGLSQQNSDVKAAYIKSGTWAKKALKDATKIGSAYSAWSGEDNNFSAMPNIDQLELEPGTSFLHITSNETISGTRIPEFFDAGMPVVADMSSDYLSRQIPWDMFDIVYGGAQKNLGPAGLAVVFVREGVIANAPDLPDYLSYGYHSGGNSLANTPPMFAIWATGKVLKWMKANGGIDGMQTRADKKSSTLYDAIDSSNGFYTGTAEPQFRSQMNVTFRLESEELEKRFISEATAADLVNLKGHRSVGGVRASIYNALPPESVNKLAEFMGDFAENAG